MYTSDKLVISGLYISICIRIIVKYTDINIWRNMKIGLISPLNRKTQISLSSLPHMIKVVKQNLFILIVMEQLETKSCLVVTYLGM